MDLFSFLEPVGLGCKPMPRHHLVVGTQIASTLPGRLAPLGVGSACWPSSEASEASCAAQLPIFLLTQATPTSLVLHQIDVREMNVKIQFCRRKDLNCL